MWVALVTALVVAQLQFALGQGESCSGITRGRHFAVTFTPNNVNNREIYLIVVAFSDHSTHVTISSKYLINGKPYVNTSVIEARGSLRTILPSELILETVSEHSNRVVLVHADSDVSVYGINSKPYSTDAFLAIPVDNLGDSYVAMGYADRNNALSFFAIVGVEDHTAVSVVLTARIMLDGVLYQRGELLEVIINAYEVVQIVAYSQEYIGGSTIESDKPIAVFTGSYCVSTTGSGCDTLSEQVVPVQSWGTNYIYTATGTPDDISIYTINVYYSDTEVNIPNMETLTLQIGEHWQGTLEGSGIITSNKPIAVLQLLRTIQQKIVDPSIIQVPSEDQFSFIFGFSTPYKSGEDNEGFFNFLNIIVKANESETLLLNGEIILNSTIPHQSIPQTDYDVYTVEIPKGEGTYYVEQGSHNTSAFAVIVYGYERSETYGYAAGLSLSSDDRFLNIEPYFVREVGGEKLVLTLPCLEKNEYAPETTKCKFSTSTELVKEVKGEVIDVYNIACITPVFHMTSYVTVDVSVDDGKTFPFRGNIHVLPQHVLPPKVVVEQSGQAFGYINFNENELIYLSWNPDDLYDVAWVDISVTAALTSIGGAGFIWSNELYTFQEVENSGHFTFSADIDEDIVKQLGTSTVLFIVKPTMPYLESVFPLLSSGFLKLIGITGCDQWPGRLHDFTPDSLIRDITPCPCTNDQALVDGNFQEDESFDLNLLHVGAASCFLASVGSGSAGQQCCYGTDGNILVGPPGGGTADAYALVNALNFGTIWHIWYDDLPWISCCMQSNECNVYYEYRPSDDCSQYQPPRPTRGTGDPHFLSLDGKEFTFNGAGEFLLLKSTLSNLTFQARMEALSGTDASVYTAFALSSHLSPLIQIQRSTKDTVMIFVDKVPIDLYFGGFVLREQTFPGMRLTVNLDLSKFRICLNTGVTLSIRITPEMMSFILQLPDTFKGKTEGLLGNFNDQPEDDLMLPDGSILPTNSTMDIIHYDFGLSWMLDVNTSIFTYLPPSDFFTFRDVNFVPTLEFPDVDNISDDMKAVCGDSSICIFDAVTTGSTTFANDSLHDVQEFETITEQSVKIVSCGFPGNVDNGHVNGSVYLVGYTVVVICNDVSYLSNGDGVLYCQPNGTWSQQLPECILISCDVPGAVDNGIVGGDVYVVGSSLNITCNDGFILLGQSIMTCQLNGTWSTDLPRCDTVNSSSGLNAALISSIVVSCLVLLAFVLSTVYFVIRRSKKKHTSNDNQQMANYEPDKILSYSQHVYD